MPTINNFEEIKKQLVFNDEYDFYHIIILRRKKDQDVPANHQSARTIKSYCIHSIQELEDKKGEIMDLCNYFNARCGINLNVFNHKDLSLEVISKGFELIKGGHYKLQYLYDKVIGNAKSKEKRWMLDIDTKDDKILSIIIDSLCEISKESYISSLLVPTYNGYHLVCKPFNSVLFNLALEKKSMSELCTISKNGFTALYYPQKTNEKL